MKNEKKNLKIFYPASKSVVNLITCSLKSANESDKTVE